MDHDVRVNDEYINQLDYLVNGGILSSYSHDHIQFFPDWSNSEYPAESRARAYLDVELRLLMIAIDLLDTAEIVKVTLTESPSER